MQEQEPNPPQAPDEEFREAEAAAYTDDPAAAAPEAGDGYTTSEFHNVIQKQVLNATYETLVETKLHWELVEPFLHASREICRGDFRRTGRIEVHGVEAQGEDWVEAEEAYLALSIADQDDGREWLSQTWWLSDIVLAGADPARVREGARALERTVAKLDAWLATQEKGPDEGS
ncbi:MAG TPA: hypothetical protein VGB08_03670 [Allosphingosinicella sp.]|jgi:hypothetical protein